MSKQKKFQAIGDLLPDATDLQERFAELSRREMPRRGDWKPPACEQCSDTGYVTGERDGMKVAVPCACRKPVHDLQRCGFSSDHATAKLEDFPERYRQAAIEIIFSAETKQRGVLILGNPGTGKTHYMAALCRYATEHGRAVAMFPSRILLRRLWATYRDGSTETESDVIEQMTGVDILAVDDLGKEGRSTDAVVSALHEILGQRHDNYRLTILTTNLKLRDGEDGAASIEGTYDASLASRMGEWFRVAMSGADRRAR